VRSGSYQAPVTNSIGFTRLTRAAKGNANACSAFSSARPRAMRVGKRGNEGEMEKYAIVCESRRRRLPLVGAMCAASREWEALLEGAVEVGPVRPRTVSRPNARSKPPQRVTAGSDVPAVSRWFVYNTGDD